MSKKQMRHKQQANEQLRTSRGERKNKQMGHAHIKREIINKQMRNKQQAIDIHDKKNNISKSTGTYITIT